MATVFELHFKHDVRPEVVNVHQHARPPRRRLQPQTLDLLAHCLCIRFQQRAVGMGMGMGIASSRLGRTVRVGRDAKREVCQRARYASRRPHTS